MIKNFLQSALRNLWKTKGYIFLNIFGLAIGIMVASLIFLWVKDELSTNNYFKHKKDIYIVKSKQVYDGVANVFESTPGTFGPAIKAEIPGIKTAARIDWGSSSLFTVGETKINQFGYYGDDELFDIFSVEFIEGNRSNAFKDVNSIVLSESGAKKLFGNEKALGKVIKVDNTKSFTVTAVTKDFPKNTFYRYEWLLPFEIYEAQNPSLKDWGNNTLQTLVQLEPTSSLEKINQQLMPFAKNKTNGQVNFYENFLYPIDRWYLNNSFDKSGIEIPGDGRIKNIQLFTTIAWLVLFMACINFMNLSTARSQKRAKEVSMRKVVGASKKSLIFQFLGESFVYAFISTLIAIVFIKLILPPFNTLVGKQLDFEILSLQTVYFLTAITAICGIVAGIYPAFFLSSFDALSTLKGEMKKSVSAIIIRKGLVVLQFTAAIVMMICTATIYYQISYVKNRDIGFDREHIITTSLNGELAKHIDAVKQDLIATGKVESTGISEYNVLNVGSNTSDFDWDGKDKSKSVLIGVTRFDQDMIKTMKMKLVDGRDFNQNLMVDSLSAIVNESFAKLVKPDGKIAGQIVKVHGMNFTIAGVVKNYVYNNMYSTAKPVFIVPFNNNYGVMNIRMKQTSDIQESITAIEKVINKYNPAYPFEYKFLDQTFENRFYSETMLQKLVSYFAILAIIICCLGLFGLASFSAEQRAKEVSIRKVLGASVSRLVAMLNYNFIMLVMLSCIIAFPIAWYFMKNWLESYSYRIDIPYTLFFITALIAVIISIITISSQAIRTALANPTKKLRNE